MTAPKWLANYDDGVPSSLEPYPSRSLSDYLRTSAARWPDRTALLFKGSAISYRKLDEQSGALAAAFVEIGLERAAFLQDYLGKDPAETMGGDVICQLTF